jgi:hypothetical protein
LFDAKLVSEWALSFDSTGAGLGRFADALNKATADTNREVEAQRQQLNNMIDDLNKGTGETVGALQAMEDQIKNGTLAAFQLLGKEDLSRLLSALDAAKSKAEALEQQAKQDQQAFDDLARSIQDEFDAATGNTKAIEDRRHKDRLDKLKELAEKAGELGTAAYNKAVKEEDDLHKRKLADIQAEQDARDGKNKSGGANTGGSGDGASKGSGRGDVPLGHSGLPSATVNGAGNRAYNIHFGDQRSADDFHDMLKALAAAKATSI